MQYLPIAQTIGVLLPQQKVATILECHCHSAMAPTTCRTTMTGSICHCSLAVAPITYGIAMATLAAVIGRTTCDCSSAQNIASNTHAIAEDCHARPLPLQWHSYDDDYWRCHDYNGYCHYYWYFQDDGLRLLQLFWLLLMYGYYHG